MVQLLQQSPDCASLSDMKTESSHQLIDAYVQVSCLRTNAYAQNAWMDENGAEIRGIGKTLAGSCRLIPTSCRRNCRWTKSRNQLVADASVRMSFTVDCVIQPPCGPLLLKFLHVATGQNPNRTVNIPIPTKIKPNMGGAPHFRMGSQNGFDPPQLQDTRMA